jgi:glucokinase
MGQAMAKSVTLGVDIGGTKVAAGLVDSSGNVLFKARVPMVATGDAAAGFAAVKGAVDAVLAANPRAKEGLAGIGICSPGPLDPRSGVVINPPNLPCWRNFALAAEMKRAFGVAARVDNDGNAAALAEAIWGAARGFENVFYATVGTGIGTGIVFKERIYHGRTGSAAEGGHVSIDYRGPRCACGKRGCIEVLCSAPAIAQQARARVQEAGDSGSMLRELSQGKLSEISAEQVGEAFRAGDALAAEILQKTADLFTVWLGNVIDLLEPDVIVIGGGAGDLIGAFFGRIQEQLPQWSINQRCREIPLLRARYGADAGIAGAAALCGAR